VTHQTAFVGDIHGNLEALIGICNALEKVDACHTVFLGDYLNKGDNSAAVIGYLLDLEKSGQASVLVGNHELALLDALETGDIASFLKMGGAMTIRSYVNMGRVGPDVLTDFRAAFPRSHLEFLQRMPAQFVMDDLDARHHPYDEHDRFHISAHVPVGRLPLIENNSAQLDTGCGGDKRGRLTAFLWPSRTFIQVDSAGNPVFSE